VEYSSPKANKKEEPRKRKARERERWEKWCKTKSERVRGPNMKMFSWFFT